MSIQSGINSSLSLLANKTHKQETQNGAQYTSIINLFIGFIFESKPLRLTV